MKQSRRVHPAGHRPRPRWRRYIAWALATIFVPVLVGVLIKIAEKPLEGEKSALSTLPPGSRPPHVSISPSPAPSVSLTPSAGPPVLIDLARVEPPGPDDGGSMVAADAIDFSHSELAELHSLPDRSRKQADWLRQHGAVDGGSVKIKIVVRGNADRGVDIVGMEAEKSCSAPLRGTMFYDPSAGEVENVPIGFDLDAPTSRAEGEVEGEWRGDYFSEKTVKLAKGESITFQVAASTRRSYCEFSLSMETLSEGKLATHMIDDHGSPFRVSAMTDENFSSYKALYLGGCSHPQ